MSVGEVKDTSLPIENAEVSAVQPANEQENKGGIRKKILAKFAEGKDFIFKKLEGKVGKLITLGQIGGVAGMTLGGLSLIFSGVAANLTVAGIPLGIPLLIGGAILFTAGTLGLVAKLAVKPDSTIGQKVKDFFSITGKNVSMGSVLGSLAAGVVTIGGLVGIGGLGGMISAVQKVKKASPKVKKVVEKVIIPKADKFNSWAQPELKKMDDVQKKPAEKVEEQDKKPASSDEPKVTDAASTQDKKEDVETLVKTVETDLARVIDQMKDGQVPKIMEKEFEKKNFDSMRYLLAAYILSGTNQQN